MLRTAHACALLLLPAVVVAQTGRPGGVRAPADTLPTYASAALRALVADAARGNRVPDSLASYRAAVESEIAVSARREDGQEALFGVEQVASVLRWTRAGYYDQHVVGDRARQSGLSFSLLSVARTGWATPLLYGNRLRLRREEPRQPPKDKAARTVDKIENGIGGRIFRGGSGSAAGGGRGTADTLPVIHPLAEDRDAYYRYTGGDTVVTLRVPTGGGGVRVIPIVRVHVEPRGPVGERTGLFVGDLDLDAVQHAVVRLRGRFLVTARPDRSLIARLRGAVAPRGYAYVEYVNAERTSPGGARYWLPATQRVELQATAPAVGDVRAIVRIVSRFTDVAINDTTLTAAELAANADSILPLARRRLTLARGDSLGRYSGWRAPIGTASGDVHADDFDDLAPGIAQVTGPPVAALFYPRISDLVHFNRVEGLYLGLGGRVRFRDAAPGLTVAATAGYAFGERTVRGRVEAEQKLGESGRRPPDAGGPGTLAAADAARWSLLARAGRTLDITNDFRAPFDSGSSLGALLGADEYDYVDRRFATVGVARAAAGRASLLRADVGFADDRGDSTHVRHPIFSRHTLYRPNRGVDEGRYLRTSVTLAWHPDVAAEFVRPGLGARLYAENGVGDLRYTRIEGMLTGRRDLLDGATGRFLGFPLAGSTLALVGRVDAGVVLAPADRGPPSQQLFELGRAQGLLGYGYKEFAGDRAGAARTALLFTGPFLRTPIRVRRLLLPAVAPGLAVTGQLGVADVSGAAARRSVARLGFRNDTIGGGGALVPAARPSGGGRASVGAGVTLFGGAVFGGVARAVDRHADRPKGVRGVVTFNQPL
ncbi:hypothetical protein tb265_13910 [Gemmatimonadetes bacterium T265]|nr:hypothetical protein tb265_13910 [Gemmatimonadetes bacterium T265]